MNKRKKKPGKLAGAKNYYRNHKRRVLIISICTILVLVGAYNVFHKRAQSMLKHDLDVVGVELDKLAQTLDESLTPNAVVERKQWCYRASRKSGREPIYCTQRIYATAENVSDEQILADAAIIKTILESSVIEFRQGTENQRPDFDNKELRTYMSFNFGKRAILGNTYCSSTFSGYSSDRAFDERTTVHSKYKLEVDCMGNGNFDRFVYPALEE